MKLSAIASLIALSLGGCVTSELVGDDVGSEVEADVAGAADAATDSAEGSDTAGGSDTTVSCDGDRLPCNGVCVDPTSNVNHCGGCNIVCSDGEVCNAGECGARCAEGLAACAGDCVDLAEDEANCGACGTPCRDGETCTDRVCIAPCDEGELSCGGRCIGVTDDRYNCGGCSVECPAGQLCVDSECACPGELELCDGECVDKSSDEANCNGCGVLCDELESCVDGLCECPEGSVRCDGACVDVSSNSDYCGSCIRSCDEGDLCVGGSCTGTCPDGFEACDGACVDTSADLAHCGSCGNDCVVGLACVEGECGCPEGTTRCGDTCRDTATDETACGTCGRTCRADQTCEGGSCACATGETDCGGACVSTVDDGDNCGRCGNVCADGQTCRDARCVCDADLTLCGSACVDTTASSTNCGSCGRACGATQSCLDGACIDTCPAGLTRCDGACVDLGSSESDCGRCGVECTGLSVCTGGACVCDADALEPNDSSGAARRLPVGDLETSSYRGTYVADLTHCSGDIDVFVVDVPLDGGTVLFETLGDCTSGALRQRVELLGASDAVVASATSGGFGSCARLTRFVDEGSYRIRVTSLDGTSGRYGLRASVTGLREKDDNNDASQADARGSFARSTTITGAIDHGLFGWSTDSDWYRFELAHVSKARLSTAASDGSCPFDSTLTLVDAAGNEVQTDDDGGAGLCSLIERTLMPGTYYAVVRAYNDSTEFDYVLDIDLPIGSELEPNGVPIIADGFGSGSIGVEGVLQELGDRDWFRLNLTATSRVTISTRGIYSSCDTDTYVDVYRADGTTLILSDDDDGEGLCSLINPASDSAFASLAAGDYYIVVRGFSDARRGSYYLNAIVE
jgi:hypothetical protein